jgi:signal transduction histidine kinase
VSARALPVAGGAAVVCLGCFLGAKLDVWLRFPGVGTAMLFPPYAILTVALVRSRPRHWWILLLAASAGDYLPHRAGGASLAFVALTELANHLRAAIAAYGLQRFTGRRMRFETVRELVVFLVFVVCLAPAIAALAGAAIAVGNASGYGFWTLWRAWASSNAITGLILLPMLTLPLSRVELAARPSPRRLVEAGLLVVGLAGAGMGVFMVPYDHPVLHPTRLYWPLPFLLWAAARFGTRGTSAALLGVTALSIWGALERLGPFASASPSDNLLQLQLFLFASSVTFLLFSALLRQEQRAQVALEDSRRKDEFLAMAGHELRNPLAPMGLALEIIRQSPVRSSESIWAVEAIDRQLRQLTRLVDDLLDIARMTTGRIRLQLAAVDLAGVVAQAAETARPLIDAAGHELVVSLPDTPLRLHADAPRLTQILTSLLNNAARYTEPGGRIELTAQTEPGAVRLSVRDNGIGIASHALETIFDLYYQAPVTPGLVRGGLGIGLTLARTLVELHGGSIRARSGGTGRGSEIIVRLPFAAEPAQVGAAPAGPIVAEGSGSLRILAVDDNTDVTQGLAQVLSLWGHDVRTAHDGVAALEVAASFDPQVVLLDLRLPKLDGIQVASRIRRSTAPALLLSMSGSGPERTPSDETDFHHHLVKPIDMVRLRTLLDAVLQRA